MNKPRFEVVIRVVQDAPEKDSYPEGRTVLHEQAVSIPAEWNLTPPRPEELLANSEHEIRMRMAQPILDAIKNAPFEGMLGLVLDSLLKRFPLKTEIKSV